MTTDQILNVIEIINNFRTKLSDNEYSVIVPYYKNNILNLKYRIANNASGSTFIIENSFGNILFSCYIRYEPYLFGDDNFNYLSQDNDCFLGVNLTRLKVTDFNTEISINEEYYSTLTEEEIFSRELLQSKNIKILHDVYKKINIKCVQVVINLSQDIQFDFNVNFLLREYYKC